MSYRVYCSCGKRAEFDVTIVIYLIYYGNAKKAYTNNDIQ